MVEKIESIGLELQCEFVREVEPSAQSEIELVKRKALQAVPAYSFGPKESHSDRGWEHVKEVEKFCRARVDDRVHIPLAEERVSQAYRKRSRDLIRHVSVDVMFDIEIRRTVIELRVRTRHYDSPV